jgi:hypothetical protein
VTYQIVNEVYNTTPAMKTVKIRPGTRPRTEYDQGKDIIARQIYSEKSSAAVCTRSISNRQKPPYPIVSASRKELQTYLLPTASTVFDTILSLELNLPTDTLGSRRRVDGNMGMGRTTTLTLKIEILQLGILVEFVTQVMSM